MGWASGSSLADGVWDAIKEFIPKAKRREVADALINLFESEDCDTMGESVLWEIVYKYNEATGEYVKR